MKSRTLVFAILLCALVLFVSSALAAENAEQEAQQPDQARGGGIGGGRCRYGCCGRGLLGQCRRCCRTESEASTMSVDLDGSLQGGGGRRGGGGGGSGHCRYGCCGGRGRYCRCCYNAEEFEAVQGGAN